MNKLGVVSLGCALGASLMGSAPAYSSPNSKSEAGSSSACSHWIYKVKREARIYDSWSAQSGTVGRVYRGNDIDSFSTGSKFVRVDNLGINGAWTNRYKTDYVAKRNLNYVTCY